MRRHEVELIVALAEGRLENEAEARALIATSPRAREMYDAQVQALGALQKLNVPVEMTEAEKSAMQRDIWTVLTTEKSAPKRTARTSPALIGYGTAAVFVVAGLFLAMNLLGPSGASVTGVQDMSTRATTEGAEPSQTPGLSADGLERLSTLAERARTGVLEYSESAEPASDVQECLEEAGLVGYIPEGAFSDAGLTYVVAVPSQAEVGPTTPIAMVERQSCTVVYRDD